jgi:precorrin-6B methylase 2
MKRLVEILLKKPRFKEFALRTLLNKLDFRLLGFKERGYLFDIGWFKTGNGLNVDENGEYIPQFSYPFLEILKTRINTEMTVLEFGIGFSSIYFAKRCKSITIIEHDPIWAKKIGDLLPKNSNILLEENLDQYLKPLEEDNNTYDIIINGIDKLRNISTQAILEKISQTGVIIFDATEKEESKQAMQKIEEKGFKRLDFWGISPGTFNNKCTSIFYRTNNVFNL